MYFCIYNGIIRIVKYEVKETCDGNSHDAINNKNRLTEIKKPQSQCHI